MSGGAFAIVARRIVLMPVQLFVILAITFALTQVAPGDPVSIIGGTRSVDPEQAELIREEFGLDGGYFERFGNYIVGLVTEGDLGPSYYYRAPKRTVEDLLVPRIWISMQISLIRDGRRLRTRHPPRRLRRRPPRHLEGPRRHRRAQTVRLPAVADLRHPHHGP